MAESRKRKEKPVKIDLYATLLAKLNGMLPVILVIVAARGVMLILNVPIFEIPMLDALLIDIWTIARDLILKLANSELIPRLA